MVKSRAQEKLVSRRGKEGPEYVLTDDEVTDVISAYAKQRRDSIDQFRETGREEAIPAEEAELAILEPTTCRSSSTKRRSPRSSMRRWRNRARPSPKDMGNVMKLVMPQVKGKADGKLVNQIVKARLVG